MLIEREGGIKIRTEEDLADIPGISEQQVALFFLRERPHLEVVYEGVLFEYCNQNGKTVGTVPDFQITNTRTGKVAYLEITSAELNGHDPKHRQKKVMEAHPGIQYTVLYRNNLVGMQKRHPNYSFLNGKKIRRERPEE